MRKPFVAGNWKMNSNGAQAEQLARDVVRDEGAQDRVEVVVCPPYPYLTRVGQAIAGSRVQLGAQNCHFESKGAFTGEVSPAMLTDCGCSWVIIGHSERRHVLDEEDDFIRKKLVGALASGLKVMYCIGETLTERRSNQTETVIETQLIGGLEGLQGDRLQQIVVAYEPVWAIGTGQNATPAQAEKAHQFIREWLDGQFGDSVAHSTRIIYGGSVNPANAASLLSQRNVDGALVGGASLVAADFKAIVAAAPKA